MQYKVTLLRGALGDRTWDHGTNRVGAMRRVDALVELHAGARTGSVGKFSGTEDVTTYYVDAVEHYRKTAERRAKI